MTPWIPALTTPSPTLNPTPSPTTSPTPSPNKPTTSLTPRLTPSLTASPTTVPVPIMNLRTIFSITPLLIRPKNSTPSSFKSTWIIAAKRRLFKTGARLIENVGG